MPSRQSWSKTIASLPSSMSRSLRMSSISRNDASSLISGIWWVSKRPCPGPVLAPDLEGEIGEACSLVAPVWKWATSYELFLVLDRVVRVAGPLPRADVGEVVVVAQGLAVVGLVLGAEVPAAALLAVECVLAHQHAEFEEVVDAAGLLQRLVELVSEPVTFRSFLNSSWSAGISDSAFSRPFALRSMPQ